jgi:hypothetical protein
VKRPLFREEVLLPVSFLWFHLLRLTPHIRMLLHSATGDVPVDVVFLATRVPLISMLPQFSKNLTTFIGL